MKNYASFLGTILFSVSLALTACDTGKKDNNKSIFLLFLLGNGGGGTVISIAAIPGVTAPAPGATPVTSITETAQYTGTVNWSGSPVTFVASRVYTATITLTAKPGYTLIGVASDFFTVEGATSDTNSANSGVVTAVFPPAGDVVFQSAVQTGGSTGTADSTGLTLTFNVDPTTLSASDITLNGATKGALSGSGKTRSLAISNITVANGATVSVTITSPTVYSISGSPQTAVVYRLLTIGMNYLGGKIAHILQPGDYGYNASVPHGRIAATADQSTGIQWYNGSYITTGATGQFFNSGPANTTAIVNNQGAGSYAAQLCNDYANTDTGEGVYYDWYLPTIEELKRLYANRVSIGGFAVDSAYWSSSELNANQAYLQLFSSIGGIAGPNDKNMTCRVRAIRAF